MGDGDNPSAKQLEALAAARDVLQTILDDRKLIGFYLKRHRERAGISLVELEKRSGVSDSEISRLESGHQDCRLQSFLKICAEMGVPAGYILDQAVVVNPVELESLIREDELFQKIAGLVDNKDVSGYISFLLAMLAGLAAQLALCTRPVHVASDIEFPDESTRAAFIQYAHQIEASPMRENRLRLLKLLKEEPMVALGALKLFEPESFRRLLKAIIDGKSTNPDRRKWVVNLFGKKWPSVLWLPFVRIEGEFPHKDNLTDAETSSKVAGNVKLQLPELLERLKKATAESGKKSELAEFLKRATKSKSVPLASVSRWLSGEREPGGEIALQMDAWATAQGFPRAK